MQSLPLRTYQIPNPDNKSTTREVAQDLIDQADEDLFCALGCWRHNPHEPFNEICYLLHQSLEKWIKAALQMSYGSFRRSHDLNVLLRPFCTMKKRKRLQGPELMIVKETLSEYLILLDRHYPDQVRYRANMPDDGKPKDHMKVMFKAICQTRQLIKHWLDERVKN